jgi:hypothetical protein
MSLRVYARIGKFDIGVEKRDRWVGHFYSDTHNFVGIIPVFVIVRWPRFYECGSCHTFATEYGCICGDLNDRQMR